MAANDKQKQKNGGEKNEKALNAMREVQVSKTGLFVGQSMEQAWSIAKAFARSEMLPKEYHNNPEKVMTAMQYAHELGLKPLTALREMTVINGNPAIFGTLPLGIVRATGLLTHIREFIIDEEGNEITRKNKNLNKTAFGAVCVVKRRGSDEEHERVFTMDDAKKAKLLQKDNWDKYPKLMLKYRARSMALKDIFPDALTGISIAEYDYDLIRENVVEDDRYVDPEVQKMIDAIKALFDELKFNNAQQLVYINKYDGHGRLDRINIAGLKELHKELKMRLQDTGKQSVIEMEAE